MSLVYQSRPRLIVGCDPRVRVDGVNLTPTPLTGTGRTWGSGRWRCHGGTTVMVISWLLVCLFGVYVIQGSHSNCISNSLCFPCLTANFPVNSLKGIFWVAIFPVFPWSSQPLRFYIIFEKKINSFNSNFWGFITVKSSFKGDKRKRSKTTKANLFSQCECTNDQAIFFFLFFPYTFPTGLVQL